MAKLRELVWISLTAAAALTVIPPKIYAQKPEESEVERAARLARRGAGLRVGTWEITDLGDSTRNSPLFEGYFQRGLDKHLSLESSAAVFRTVSPAAGGLFGSGETKGYILPLLTALKFYPFTTIDDGVEPYIMGGVGFALGIEDSGSTAVVTGFGFKGAAGVEFHLSPAFGLLAGGRYQWVKYGENLAGRDTFKGVGFEGGITYRFQY